MNSGRAGRDVVSRRGLLTKSAAVAALGALGGSAAAMEPVRPEDRRRRAQVGLQLYSVRGECQEDLPGGINADCPHQYQ